MALKRDKIFYLERDRTEFSQRFFELLECPVFQGLINTFSIGFTEEE